MPITIENPTAQTAFEALQGLPVEELLKLKEMFTHADFGGDYQDFWTEEDIEDFRASTGRLIEKRLGEEKYNYD